MKIGFVGLGIMGSRMAANLLAGGVDLVVHNRTKELRRPPCLNKALSGPIAQAIWQMWLLFLPCWLIQKQW